MDQKKTFKPMDIGIAADMFREIGIPSERLIIRERLAINLDMEKRKVSPEILHILSTPYHIADNRILRVLSGSVTIEINLNDCILSQGDLLLMKEDTYYEMKYLSEDTRMEMVVFTPDKYPTNLPYWLHGASAIHPEKEEWERTGRLIHTIYSFAKEEPYRKDVVEPLVTALLNYVLELAREENSGRAASGMEFLFSRFMAELNRSGTGKLPVSHYAEKLCVSPQYLSKAVSQTSGKTVSQWINKAVITKAKVLLRDRSRTVSEISEALSFPNDSFFCRFFKRETGMTPTQYRKSQT
ncbi:MAG: helix-turn-helix domain-containing protein [Candidatus Cryptobacteroides sp.]